MYAARSGDGLRPGRFARAGFVFARKRPGQKLSVSANSLRSTKNAAFNARAARVLAMKSRKITFLVSIQRGSKTLIGTLSDPPFDSKFSGNTIDICPVGALTSRAFRFRARVWELKNTPTISMVDGCGTNIFVGQRNETFVRVIPRDNEAINECWISDRDRFGLE